MPTLGWNELVEVMATRKFADLLFEGAFHMSNGIRCFLPSATPVYLEFADHGLLKLSSDDSGRLAFSLVDAPTWDSFGDDWDDMDSVGVVSMHHTYFGESPAAQCEILRCAFASSREKEDGPVLAAEMTFSGRHRVVVDPSWPAGMRVLAGPELESVLAFHWNQDVKSVRTWRRATG